MKYYYRVQYYILDLLRYVYYSLRNKRHRFNMARYKKCNDKKSGSQIRSELKELKRYWGCIPMQYYTHDFYRSDCPLSIEDMKSYIPGFYFYFILYPRFDDLSGADYVLENKITCAFLFSGMKLPITDMLALKKGKHFFEKDGAGIDTNALIAKINSNKAEKIFVKPVSGCGGAGIQVLKKESEGYCVDGNMFDEIELLKLSGDYVFESKIDQSEYLNEVYPHSVNTLRAVTARMSDGSISLVAVTLRMGAAGRQVDNSAQGGLLIGLNLETGVPFKEYAGYEYGCEKIFKHPDTGFEFKNLEILDWPEIKASIVEFAQKMVLYNLVGWDIALTDDGPVVIEANTKFGIDHSQSGVGGMKDSFVIGSPRERRFK